MTRGSPLGHGRLPAGDKESSVRVASVPDGSVIRCKELEQVGQGTSCLKSREDDAIISTTGSHTSTRTGPETSLPHRRAQSSRLEKLEITLFEAKQWRF